jgi:hypothetical protein
VVWEAEGVEVVEEEVAEEAEEVEEVVVEVEVVVGEKAAMAVADAVTPPVRPLGSAKRILG